MRTLSVPMAADSASPLQAVAIVEHDTNNDVMLAWCYPSLAPVELEAVVVAQAEPFLTGSKAAAPGDTKRASYFTRFGASWLYGCVRSRASDPLRFRFVPHVRAGVR